MRLALDCALTERGFHPGVPAHPSSMEVLRRGVCLSYNFRCKRLEMRRGGNPASHRRFQEQSAWQFPLTR